MKSITLNPVGRLRSVIIVRRMSPTLNTQVILTKRYRAMEHDIPIARYATMPVDNRTKENHTSICRHVSEIPNEKRLNILFVQMYQIALPTIR